jgi:acid phosphatase (class A)
MTIDTAHHRLFSGCRSGVMAISDYQAGKVVATVPIGSGVDGAGFDPASGDAFASNADGTLTVIHQDTPDQYHVAETLETPRGSRNMGLDPTNHRIYLVAAKFGTVPAGAPARTRPPMLPGSFSLLVVEPVRPVSAQPAARPAKRLQCLTAAEIDPSRLLPSPPADGSDTQQREMAEVQRVIQTRTPGRYQRAKWDNQYEDPTPFAEVLGPQFDLQELPATARLLATVINDATMAASTAKDYFHRKFPIAAADPAPVAFADWTCDVVPRRPTEWPLRSYPSGHATLGYTLGIILANLFPEKAQAIQARAAEYGYSRQVCGDHYRSDVDAGHALGNAIGILLLENAALKPQIEAAKAELRSAHLTE